MRSSLESYLLNHCNNIPIDTGFDGNAMRLLKVSDITPTMGRGDILRLAVDTTLLNVSNPFFTDASVEHVQAASRLWLQLCVLEDRIERLEQFSNPGHEQEEDLIQVKSLWRLVSICVMPCFD